MDAMEIILVEDDEEVAVPMLKFLKKNFNNEIRYIQDGGRAAEYFVNQRFINKKTEWHTGDNNLH